MLAIFIQSLYITFAYDITSFYDDLKKVKQPNDSVHHEAKLMS